MQFYCSCGVESKYCCPKCGARTCSLACVKKHKSEKKCDGVADKTQFVKISEFDTMKLISDYKFLEGVKETVDSSQRHLEKMKSQTRGDPRFRSCLANNTLLKFMPDTFTRHKENNSFCKDRQLFWTVELVFTELNSKIISHEVADTDSVEDVLSRYRTISTDLEQYKTVTQYFKFKPKVAYLVRADVGKPNCYHKINPKESLRDCLRSKTVIEFPTVYLVKDVEEYTVVPCEEVNVREKLGENGGGGGKRKRKKMGGGGQNKNGKKWKGKKGKPAPKEERKCDEGKSLKKGDEKKKGEEEEKEEGEIIGDGEMEEGELGQTESEKPETEKKRDSFRDSVLALFGGVDVL